MKKLIVMVFFASGLAFAQGVRYDIPPILGPTGQPLPNIAVALCLGTGANVQTYAWNAIFRGSTTNALPTSTSGGGTDYIGFTFNAADTKWDCTTVDMGH